MAETATAPVAPSKPSPGGTPGDKLSNTTPRESGGSPSSKETTQAQAEPKTEQRYDAGGNPLVPVTGKKGAIQRAEPKPAKKEAPKEEAEAPDSEGDERVSDEPLAADEDSRSDSGATDSDEHTSRPDDGEPEPGDKPALGDDTEVEVGDEKIPLKALKEAYAESEKAGRLTQIAQRALNAIRDQGEHAFLDIMASVHGGDREKARAEVDDMGARILGRFTNKDLVQKIMKDGLPLCDGVPLHVAAQACALVQKLLDFQKLPPEQQELNQLRFTVETEKERTARILEEERAKRANVLRERAMAQLSEEMPAALEEVGIPIPEEPTDDYDPMSSLRDIMLKSYDAQNPLSAKEAAAVLKKIYERQRREALASAGINDIPVDLRKRLRQDDIAQVTGREPTRQPARRVAPGGERHKLPERRMMF